MRTPITLLISILSLAGCSREFADFCGKKVDCEGGNDKDKLACTDDVEALEDKASDYDCGGLFDAWIKCQTESSTCTDAKYAPSSSDCVAQNRDLDNCQSLSSGKKK